MKEFKGSSTPWHNTQNGIRDEYVSLVCTVSDTLDQNCMKANAALIAAAPDLLKACMDYENPISQTVADCLRELSHLLPKNETQWIEWCNKQADVIESAITKALTI